MNIKKITTLLIISWLSIISSKTFAITLRTLRETKDTAQHGWSAVEGSTSILGLISLINTYLRFSVGFFCFVFMIINGYKLISSNGDEKAMKSAKTGLFWSLIWITICLLSYIIVNLAVKILA